jgi:cytosine/adenosine deaminase-related metal-dependent hydrolase
MHPRVDILKSVVFAMSDRAVTDVWVHGRHVVEAGRLVTLDEHELLGRVRELTRDWRVPEPAASAGLGRAAAP